MRADSGREFSRMLETYFNVLLPSPNSGEPHDAAKIQEALKRDGPSHWYNKIEVVKGSGVFTEPYDVDFNGKNFFEFLGIEPERLKGARLLDIGAFDGAVSFFCEDFGAEVVSIDIQSPESNGFALVHKLRQSSVTHVQCSIYDLHPDLFGTFDFVVLSGVHYHLRHPLLGLERVNSVTKQGGCLLAVGTVSDFWLHSRKSEKIGAVIAEETQKELPICGFYRDKFMNDRSNWFIPNTVCLEDWITSCGFEVEFSQTSPLPHHERLHIPSGSRGSASIRAKKVREPDTEFDVAVYSHLRVSSRQTATIDNFIPTRYEASVSKTD